MKLLLGILIGIGIAFTGVALANTGQSWRISGTRVDKIRDGEVICYVSDGYNSGGISCLVEPR